MCQSWPLYHTLPSQASSYGVKSTTKLLYGLSSRVTRNCPILKPAFKHISNHYGPYISLVTLIPFFTFYAARSCINSRASPSIRLTMQFYNEATKNVNRKLENGKFETSIA